MLDAPEAARRDGGFGGALGRVQRSGGGETEGGAGGEGAQETGDEGGHGGGHKEDEADGEEEVGAWEMQLCGRVWNVFTKLMLSIQESSFGSCPRI